MNLINDLDTEIAFAVLFEKKHQGKLKSRDILPLIGRLNKALEEISKKNEDENYPASGDSPVSHIATH